MFSPHILHLKRLVNSCLIWLHKKAIMIWQKLALRKVPRLDFAWRYDNSFFLKWIWQIKAAVLIMRKVITFFLFARKKMWKSFNLENSFLFTAKLPHCFFFWIGSSKKKIAYCKIFEEGLPKLSWDFVFWNFLHKINVKHMKNTLLKKIQLRRWQVEKQQNNVTGRSRQSFPPPNFSSLYPVMGLTPIFFEIVSLSLVALMH